MQFPGAFRRAKWQTGRPTHTHDLHWILPCTCLPLCPTPPPFSISLTLKEQKSLFRASPQAWQPQLQKRVLAEGDLFSGPRGKKRPHVLSSPRSSLFT